MEERERERIRVGHLDLFRLCGGCFSLQILYTGDIYIYIYIYIYNLTSACHWKLSPPPPALLSCLLARRPSRQLHSANSFCCALMAGPRARSNSVRRARGLSIGEDGKPVPLKRWDGASRTCRDWDGLRRVSCIRHGFGHVHQRTMFLTVCLLVGSRDMGTKRQLPRPPVRQGRLQAWAVLQAALCGSAVGRMPPAD